MGPEGLQRGEWPSLSGYREVCLLSTCHGAGLMWREQVYCKEKFLETGAPDWGGGAMVRARHTACSQLQPHFSVFRTHESWDTEKENQRK